MKIVLDTNVLMSALFFGGKPLRILDAWEAKTFGLLITQDILSEYTTVAENLGKKYKSIDLTEVIHAIDILAIHSDIIPAVYTDQPICEDPDDDKFILCALSGGAACIVSGDSHLLSKSGYGGIKVLKPNDFLKTYF